MPTSYEEFNWILKQGIKSIVTMTENSLPEKWVENIGYLHVPTPDLTAPDMEKIDSAVDFIHEKISEDDAVMVHCAAGMGRAGTILACYYVKYHKFTINNCNFYGFVILKYQSQLVSRIFNFDKFCHFNRFIICHLLSLRNGNCFYLSINCFYE